MICHPFEKVGETFKIPNKKKNLISNRFGGGVISEIHSNNNEIV